MSKSDTDALSCTIGQKQQELSNLKQSLSDLQCKLSTSEASANSSVANFSSLQTACSDKVAQKTAELSDLQQNLSVSKTKLHEAEDKAKHAVEQFNGLEAKVQTAELTLKSQLDVFAKIIQLSAQYYSSSMEAVTKEVHNDHEHSASFSEQETTVTGVAQDFNA